METDIGDAGRPYIGPFSITKRLHGSYQLGSVYRVGKKHILRASASYGMGNLSAQNYLYYDASSNSYNSHQRLNPMKVRTYEIGYRFEPYQDLRFEIGYFLNATSDFIELPSTLSEEKTNSTADRVQRGITMDVHWSANKFTTNAFLTLQSTTTTDNARTLGDPSVPRYIGGLTGNYRMFLNKLRLNAGFYCYGASMLTETNAAYSLSAKLITNVRISYNVWDEHAVFFNGRNVLNDSHPEVPYADQAKNLYMFGIDLVF